MHGFIESASEVIESQLFTNTRLRLDKVGRRIISLKYEILNLASMDALFGAFPVLGTALKLSHVMYSQYVLNLLICWRLLLALLNFFEKNVIAKVQDF